MKLDFLVLLYTAGIMYALMPLVFPGIYVFLPTNQSYETTFFYCIEHVIDIESYYKLLMLHMIINIFYIVSLTIGIDSLFVLYVQHACALFENIR